MSWKWRQANPQITKHYKAAHKTNFKTYIVSSMGSVPYSSERETYIQRLILVRVCYQMHLWRLRTPSRQPPLLTLTGFTGSL